MMLNVIEQAYNFLSYTKTGFIISSLVTGAFVVFVLAVAWSLTDLTDALLLLVALGLFERRRG